MLLPRARPATRRCRRRCARSTPAARAALTEILAREPGAEHLAGAPTPRRSRWPSEVIRSGLTGLAVWWGEHPHVAREQVVATAINVVWLGFERVRRGEGWEASR